MRIKKDLLKCRFCNTPLRHTFVDLGMSPVANDYIGKKDINKKESFYPLHVYVCSNCFLVQIPNIIEREKIFNKNYAYFSSYSTSWLEHSKKYVDSITKKLKLGKKDLVVELASNDGYLLQYFKEKKVPILGFEPCENIARVAKEKGINTIVKFFGIETAYKLSKDKKADLIIANNVLAHVPDLNDFVGGMKILLNKDGVITIEFPHILKMIENNQFDTIYHEHYSYFSLSAVNRVFAFHGLTIFDVEKLKTHGGSLRIFAKHMESGRYKTTKRMKDLLNEEDKKGLSSIKFYSKFQKDVLKTKKNLIKFLNSASKKGKTVVGYGAPAKGNTLLNYCGINSKYIKYTVDRSPYKQNHLLPGSRIPIYEPNKIFETKPDYILILPWNLKKEITKQVKLTKKWNAKFVVPIPKVEVV
jgi:2-polyprenyl-3-methyl-5-hydroxy-6-metoxy-1,4-benzoquinol methylase